MVYLGLMMLANNIGSVVFLNICGGQMVKN